MKYIFAAFIGISLAALLSACSFMPKPLNNPAVSTLGKKCTTSGHWSYVWIHDRDVELRASNEYCNE